MSRHAQGFDPKNADVPRFPPHFCAMTWRAGVFLHWPVDPAVLRPYVPDALDLDIYEGEAWISILPFMLADIKLRGFPDWSGLTIGELNVRTYVRYRGDPGLYFFSIDVDSPMIAFAARRAGLSCHRSMIRVDRDNWIALGCSRPGSSPTACFAAKYRPEGTVTHPEPDSLTYWLIERRRFYELTPWGILTAEIAHSPWPLQEVDLKITENTMFAANDLPQPQDELIAHYCGELEMTGSLPRLLPK